MTYVGDDPAVWRPIFRSRLHGKKHEDFEATAEFLGRRSIKVPKAVAGTTRLLGRAPRSYRDYVAERAVSTRTAARRKS